MFIGIYGIYMYIPVLCHFRISYSVYELEKLKASVSSESLNVVLMYDIACVLSTHLQVLLVYFFIFVF